MARCAVTGQYVGSVGRNVSTAWKTLGERKSRGNQTAIEGPLVGLAEVAELLGVTKRTATAYCARDDFPEPLQRLAATPVWHRAEVEAWAKKALPLTRGRPPGPS